MPRCTNVLSPTNQCPCITARCSTGQCYETSESCSASLICPSTFIACPDYHCVSSRDQCSQIVACPPSTVLCGDLKRCGLSQEECEFIPSRTCPRHAPLLCADGATCATAYEECPFTPSCPVGQVRCESGVCRDSVEECVIHTPCPLDRPLRCSDGSCSSATDVTCGSIVTCPREYILTTDGRCISKVGHGSGMITTSGKCPSSMVTCPDKTCALSYHLCPVQPLCSFGMVLCEDGSCRANQVFCPAHKETCPPPLLLCSNNECVHRPEDCIPGVICPEDRPVLCKEAICVASMRLCLELVRAEALYYGFSDSNVQLLQRDEYRNDTEGIIVNLEMLVDQQPCPWAYPYYCPLSSRCVAHLEDCSHNPPCPSSLPYRCFDGRCAAGLTDCPDSLSYEARVKCPVGLEICPLTDVCVKSRLLCPTRRVCADDETLCSNGSCKSLLGSVSEQPSYLTETSIMGDLWLTYLEGKELYEFFDTSLSITIRQCIYSQVNTEGFANQCCVGGVCSGSSYSECLENKIAEVEKDCEAESRNYPCEACSAEFANKLKCPAGMKHCFDGHCVNQTVTCPSVTVCPRDLPVRCMNGQCVLTRHQCESYTECPNNQILCEDGSCADSFDTCSFIVCPSDRPILCWDQSCRKAISDCPEPQHCATGLYFCGVTGECVYDRSTCTSSRSEKSK